MGQTRLHLMMCCLLTSFLLLGCGNSKQEEGTTGQTGPSIAGDYACSKEGTGKDRPTYGWALREDGTLTNNSPPGIIALGTTPEEKIVKGTWSTKDGSGKVTSEGKDYVFTIGQDRLVFRDGKFVCFKAPR